MILLRYKHLTTNINKHYLIQTYIVKLRQELQIIFGKNQS